jgi:hypothetical protein
MQAPGMLKGDAAGGAGQASIATPSSPLLSLFEKVNELENPGGETAQCSSAVRIVNELTLPISIRLRKTYLEQTAGMPAQGIFANPFERFKNRSHPAMERVLEAFSSGFTPVRCIAAR